MVSEIFNVECNAMVDMTLIRPLNKGQGRLKINRSTGLVNSYAKHAGIRRLKWQ